VSAVPPIRREILVDTDPATAFEVFTDRLGHWWPLAELSVYGAGATVEFSGGQIIERSADGQAAVWGTVTRWEPPEKLAFSWHPGQAAERASHVEVTFAAAADQTRVRLEHSGWEALDDPFAARAEYDHGWPMVLDRYRDDTARNSDNDPHAETDDDDTWVALLHRPGPAAPATGTLFEDPRFAEHIAFLNRMREAGYLVAAGPLPDAAGEGMTILRLPGPGQLSLAMRLATEDDTSVSAGFLAVTVRPWHVVMHT
jgi:uncharacterized protein YndB with AHSA1/START domain/uncharacterized protein YciI